MNLKPLEDRVIIEPIKEEEKTKNGLRFCVLISDILFIIFLALYA